MELSAEIKSLIKLLKHQNQVSFLLRQIAREFERRADVHDQSKLNLDEFEGFVEIDIKRDFQKEQYGSKGYEDVFTNIDAIGLHLSRNSHHPEFYPNGIEDMSFFDILEMLCDWEVARQTRDLETDINVTWQVRQKRFNLTDEQIIFLKTTWNKIWKGS